MIKKTVTYEDYNGLERTESFYFNLTEAELAKMEFVGNSSFSEKLQRMVDSKDVGDIIDTFSKILQISYGVKSDDGRRFIKNDEVYKSFEESPAYSIVFMDFLKNPDDMVEFVKGAMPKSLLKEVETKERELVQVL